MKNPPFFIHFPYRGIPSLYKTRCLRTGLDLYPIVMAGSKTLWRPSHGKFLGKKGRGSIIKNFTFSRRTLIKSKRFHNKTVFSPPTKNPKPFNGHSDEKVKKKKLEYKREIREERASPLSDGRRRFGGRE